MNTIKTCMLLIVGCLSMRAQTPQKPATPTQLAPSAGTELHNYPREIEFQWSPAGGAETYTLEVDCLGCCVAGKWCAETAPGPLMTYRDLQTTRFSIEYVSDQPGRWRISAVAGTLDSEKSPWREFSFKTDVHTPALDAPVQASPRAYAPVVSGLAPLGFAWSPVAGAESYILEMDTYGSCSAGKWCSEVGKSVVVDSIKDTSTTLDLPQADRVRWRVQAVAGARKSLKSPWREFGVNAGIMRPGATQPEVLYDGPVYSTGVDGVSPPVPIYPNPPLPEQDSRNAFNGTVVVRVIVAPDGTPRNARMTQPSSRDDVNQKVFDVVQAWRFKPGTKDGQAVAVWATITFTFRNL